MAKVEFLGPINKSPIEVDITHLEQLKNLFKDDKELQQWLEVCAVAVNDTLTATIDIPINPNDKISLLPPVCGG